jgi:Antitoxin-like ribbon-helix-helix
MARKRRSAGSVRAAKAQRGPTEQNVRGLLIRVNPAGLKALRQLALDRDTTLQAIAVEGLNDLLKKHGAKAVIMNPLRQTD